MEKLSRKILYRRYSYNLHLLACHYNDAGLASVNNYFGVLYFDVCEGKYHLNSVKFCSVYFYGFT